MNRYEAESIDGLLLLDKPLGISSNVALQKVKRLLGARKAGHTGSLDPMASGLLPICFGEATKFSGFLLDSTKRYRVLVRLGITTATGDREGAVLKTYPVPPLDAGRIGIALDRFRGETLQVPPMYSALKYRGHRLYDLARKGLDVDRAPRPVTIHELRLNDFGENELDLDVHCSKGTYIRSLAEDLGRALGCGGHVAALRRTAVGGFDLAGSKSIDELTALPAGMLPELLFPVDRIVADLPPVRLDDEVGFFLRKGNPVRIANAPPAGWVRIYLGNDEFLGVGEVLADGRVAPKRLIQSKAQ